MSFTLWILHYVTFIISLTLCDLNFFYIYLQERYKNYTDETRRKDCKPCTRLEIHDSVLFSLYAVLVNNKKISKTETIFLEKYTFARIPTYAKQNIRHD